MYIPATNSLRLRRPIRRTRTISMDIRFGLLALFILLFIFFVAVIFFYLSHFNSVSTKGYALNKLQNERNELVEENEVQEMLISRARALATIQYSKKVQSMIPVDFHAITYIKGDTALAQR